MYFSFETEKGVPIWNYLCTKHKKFPFVLKYVTSFISQKYFMIIKNSRECAIMASFHKVCTETKQQNNVLRQFMTK